MVVPAKPLIAAAEPARPFQPQLEGRQPDLTERGIKLLDHRFIQLAVKAQGDVQVFTRAPVGVRHAGHFGAGLIGDGVRQGQGGENTKRHGLRGHARGGCVKRARRRIREIPLIIRDIRM